MDKSLDTDKGRVGKAEHVQLCRVSEKAAFQQMLGWDETGVENVGTLPEMLVRQSAMGLADGMVAAAAAAVG